MGTAILSILFQMVGDLGIYYERIAVSLGFTTLVAGLATFTSCRSFTSLVDFFTQKSPIQYKLFKRFYRFHAYYWWIFLLAVAGHITASSIHTDVWPR
jgi:hypothetical protein